MTDWNNDFRARLNFAASYISGGKPTSRKFDSCFENSDGDAVVVALYRRTVEKPETKLAANLWRYISRESTMAAVERHAHWRTQDLGNLAAQLRDDSRKRFAEAMERMDAEQKAKAADKLPTALSAPAQSLIPGLAPVSPAERLQARQRGRKQATCAQQPPNHGLFDLGARVQADFISES